MNKSNQNIGFLTLSRRLNNNMVTAIRIFVDVILLYLFIISRHQNVLNAFLALIIISIFWLLTGYIFNRYTFKNIVKIKLSSIVFSEIIFYVLNLFFIVLLNTYFRFFEGNLFDLSSILLFINIESILVQLIANITSDKNKCKKWILISNNKEDKEMLEKYIKIAKRNHSITIHNEDVLKSDFFEKYKNQKIILSSENYELISKIKIRNIYSNIYMINDWAEEYLELLIPELCINIDNLNIDRKSYLIKFKYYFILKNLLDKLLALLLLLLFLPVMALSIISIFLEDGNPVFYSQRRNGINKKIFKIWKLRSMKIDSEKNGVKWATKNDKRITLIGSIIRKTRIDELPQLIQVFKSKLSLIGPRPERPEIDLNLQKLISSYNIRYKIKPGISGWAQVNYPYGSSVEDAKNKLAFDLYYIKNMSLKLDFIILFKTIKLVLKAEGSVPN